MAFKSFTVALLLAGSMVAVLGAALGDPVQESMKNNYYSPTVPHAIDPNAEYYPGFYMTPHEEENPLATTPPTALTKVLTAIGRVGVYVLGAAAVIVVGAFFTAALCTYTPFCTIKINGLPTLSKDTVRSLVNPDNISSAAAFVQNAVDKYERFQREAGHFY